MELRPRVRMHFPVSIAHLSLRIEYALDPVTPLYVRASSGEETYIHCPSICLLQDNRAWKKAIACSRANIGRSSILDEGMYQNYLNIAFNVSCMHVCSIVFTFEIMMCSHQVHNRERHGRLGDHEDFEMAPQRMLDTYWHGKMSVMRGIVMLTKHVLCIVTLRVWRRSLPLNKSLPFPHDVKPSRK